jgi:hypothetical protein
VPNLGVLRPTHATNGKGDSRAGSRERPSSHLSQPPSRTVGVNKPAPASTLLTSHPHPNYVACSSRRDYAFYDIIMADRRSVRSTSRRKTPTPQPQAKAKATAEQVGRASRARSLRSASREVGDFIDIQKPTRRSARQASVTTNDESDYETRKARKTKRKPAKELLGG